MIKTKSVIEWVLFGLIGIPIISFLPCLGKKYDIPIEVLGVPAIAIIMLYHVLTLPKDTNKHRKVAKYLGAICYLIFSFVVLLNEYIVHFFKYHYFLLVGALLPAALYSLVFERKSNT